MSSSNLFLLVCLLCALAGASAERMEYHSFEPPYDQVDATGNRVVSKEWKNGGVASVNTNFVRLTPDRQSKKGALWSRKSLGVDTFSTIVKFRISGQGKKFFGDGMAVWFMQQAYYVEGDFHGTAERFTGFGVIFDTFKNTETLAYHRDVSLVYNDGERTTELMLENKEGCDANIRYHEDRGDFSDCLTTTLPLDEGWVRQAHVGLTASTGQLADNHDVLSLVTFSDPVKHEEQDALAVAAPKFERGEGLSEERLARLEDAVNKVMEKLDFLEHHTEHELVAVEDHLKVTASKLQAQEAISEGRIDELEAKVMDSVKGSMEDRLAQVERSLDGAIGHRISSVESILHERLAETVSDTVKGMGGWQLPFMFLFLMFIAAAIGLHQWYKRLKKTHML